MPIDLHNGSCPSTHRDIAAPCGNIRAFQFTLGRAHCMVPPIRRMGMAFGPELKRRAKAASAPVIFLAITGYFGWSATQGNHGLVAYAQRQDLLRQADAEHAAAQAERDTWERRVGGLRANHLHPEHPAER